MFYINSFRCLTFPIYLLPSLCPVFCSSSVIFHNTLRRPTYNAPRQSPAMTIGSPIKSMGMISSYKVRQKINTCNYLE